MSNSTTLSSIHKQIISTLIGEAGEAGDFEMVAIGKLALQGDSAAFTECKRVTDEAFLNGYSTVRGLGQR